MIRSVFATVAIVVAAAFAAAPAGAEDAAEASKAFIQEMADRVITVAKSSTERPFDEVRAEFKTVVHDAFDVPLIGQYVVGRYWKRAEDAERETFLMLFEKLMVDTYASQLTAFSGEGVDVVGVRVDSPKVAIVTTELERAEGDPFKIDWRVRTIDEMRIIDVVVEGVSLVQTQRSEYASVMRSKGGLSGLNVILEEKVAEAEAEHAAKKEASNASSDETVEDESVDGDDAPKS